MRWRYLSIIQVRTLTLYIDYKSPYAYLAKEPAYRLERDPSRRFLPTKEPRNPRVRVVKVANPL